MLWFGPDWGAPVCDPDQHVTMPTRWPCERCGVAFKEGDQGVLLPFFVTPSQWAEGRPYNVAYHRICFLACVMPVEIHLLRYGFAVCGFCRHVAPGNWPPLHYWTERLEQVTCGKCKAEPS